jgi:hypothetical protein
MRCFFCGGVYHPSTGHRWNERVVACGPCAKDFVRWLRGMLNRKWGKQNFYEAAIKFAPEGEGFRVRWNEAD